MKENMIAFISGIFITLFFLVPTKREKQSSFYQDKKSFFEEKSYTTKMANKRIQLPRKQSYKRKKLRLSSRGKQLRFSTHGKKLQKTDSLIKNSKDKRVHQVQIGNESKPSKSKQLQKNKDKTNSKKDGSLSQSKKESYKKDSKAKKTAPSSLKPQTAITLYPPHSFVENGKRPAHMRTKPKNFHFTNEEKTLSHWMDRIVKKEDKKALEEFVYFLNLKKIKNSIFKDVLEAMLEKGSLYPKAMNLLEKNPSSLSFYILSQHLRKVSDEEKENSLRESLHSYLEPHKISYLIQVLRNEGLSSQTTYKALEILSQREENIQNLAYDTKRNLFTALAYFQEEHNKLLYSRKELSKLEEENYSLAYDIMGLMKRIGSSEAI